MFTELEPGDVNNFVNVAEGVQINIEASGIHTIKGSLVKIN